MAENNVTLGIPGGPGDVTAHPGGVAAVPGGTGNAGHDYDRFVADVWVCVALTLMILSCVGLLCSCILYHKLQQWKQHAERSGAANEEDRRDSLPSYTLVTGLPTYEQAMASAMDKPESRGKSPRHSFNQSDQHEEQQLKKP